jgi:hypothetical protein
MYIPKTIGELLDERILFCETTLEMQNDIPDCKEKDEMLNEFALALKNYKEIKRLLESLQSSNTNDKYTLSSRFHKAASKLIYEMIGNCKKQIEGVRDLVVIHYTLDLIDGLEKINLEISGI